MVPRKQETSWTAALSDAAASAGRTQQGDHTRAASPRATVARVRAARKQGDTLDRLVLQGTWGRDGAMVAVPPKREFKLSFERQRTDIAGDPEGIRTPDLHRDRVAC
jgi:hypothetical protein